MIPLLTKDEESIDKNWNTKESADWVKDYCEVVYASNSSIPLYSCDEYWVSMGVFKEFKSIYKISEFFIYGYCDTEEALLKYLQQYIDDKDNNYFVSIGGMDMDYEKYYKNGSYINKDGIDTGDDYYEYIDNHPEMKVKQDIENRWITFEIYKLKE